MVDFTNFEIRKKAYGGANGNKLSILYNGELYMLKLPSHAQKNPNLSYINSSVSEYLGCHIFNMLGVRAQETILGKFYYHNQERVVVACKDFTSNNNFLLDFASVKNQIIDSESNGYGTDITDILNTIEKQNAVNSDELMKHFWNMFIIDAFIGNWDRHNGNWGFLYNQELDIMEIAPIYDCGSALYPQADDNILNRVLSSKSEMNSRVYDVPTSAILFDGKRGNYFNIITSLKYKGCNEAILRIVPRINMDDIYSLIDNTEELSNIKKEFLKKILKMRKELILDVAFKKLT